MYHHPGLTLAGLQHLLLDCQVHQCLPVPMQNHAELLIQSINAAYPACNQILRMTNQHQLLFWGSNESLGYKMLGMHLLFAYAVQLNVTVRA